MQPQDKKIIFKIAQTALEHALSSEIIAEELGLSQEECDRLYTLMEDETHQQTAHTVEAFIKNLEI